MGQKWGIWVILLLLAMFLLIKCLSLAQDTHFIKLRFIRALEELLIGL